MHLLGQMVLASYSFFHNIFLLYIGTPTDIKRGTRFLSLASHGMPNLILLAVIPSQDSREWLQEEDNSH